MTDSAGDAVEVDLDRLTPAARHVLDAAARLFYDRGIHAVGVDAIAAGSGVTKRTLYNNFGSKDALIVAYLRERDRRWWRALESQVASTDQPRALAFFDLYAQDAQTATRGCAFLNAAAELPSDHPAYAVVRDHKKGIERRLAVLVAEDGAPDPERLARHLFLLLEGAFTHQGVRGPDLLIEAREIARGLLEQRA